MNNVVLVGNLARDPEQRTTASGTPVTTFTVAVSRNFKNHDGQYEADFITCVAWRSTAEFVSKWFRKGKAIGVTGRLQSRSYDDNQGQRRYVTEVVVENVEFVGNRNDNGGQYGGGYGSNGGSSSGSQGGGYQGGYGSQAPPARQAPPPTNDSKFQDDIGGDPGYDAMKNSDNFESLEDSELPF